MWQIHDAAVDRFFTAVNFNMNICSMVIWPSLLFSPVVVIISFSKEVRAAVTTPRPSHFPHTERDPEVRHGYALSCLDLPALPDVSSAMPE